MTKRDEKHRLDDVSVVEMMAKMTPDQIEQVRRMLADLEASEQSRRDHEVKCDECGHKCDGSKCDECPMCGRPF